MRSIVRIDGYNKQQQTDRRTNRPTSIDAIERDIYGDGNAYWLNSPAQKALCSLGWDPLFVSRGWFLDSWLVILRESFNFLTWDERKNIGTRAWDDRFSLVYFLSCPARALERSGAERAPERSGDRLSGDRRIFWYLKSLSTFRPRAAYYQR